MAIKDKLVNLEDLKTVKDALVANEIGDVKSAISDTDGTIVYPADLKDEINSIVNITANLYNYKHNLDGYAYGSDGVLRTSSTTSVSDYIKVDPSTTYICGPTGPRITLFKDNQGTLATVYNIAPANPSTFTTGADVEYIRLTVTNAKTTTTMLIKGNALPDDYVPYGIALSLKENIEVPNIGLLLEMVIAPNTESGKYWKKDSNDKIAKATYADLTAIDPISVVKGDQYYIYSIGAAAGSTYFVCDESGNVLVDGGVDEVKGIITISDNSAAYLYINIYKTHLDKYKVAKVTPSNLNDIIIKNRERIDSLSSQQDITICCTGDSVTQGMQTDGSQTADYGKSPYPARLTTLLVDEGYSGITVYNQGHGGERMPDVAARLGGRLCYITEDITIPSDNSWVSLGQYSVSDYQITGTKLKINYKNISNADYNVYFTQLSSDTNPVYIDGIAYEMKIENNTNYIRKATADGESTTIKAGTMVFTNEHRNPTVNIIFAGYNGHQSLTCAKWLELNRLCGEVNGGKYIVIGSTIAIWEDWTDISGTTSAEKYADYKAKTYGEFGIHFLDLYTDFFDHALPYALSAGYFSDATSEELAQMETLLAQHILPAEFSYDGEHQGNVHMNESGYHVIGMLLLDRLKRLNYIPVSPT